MQITIIRLSHSGSEAITMLSHLPQVVRLYSRLGVNSSYRRQFVARSEVIPFHFSNDLRTRSHSSIGSKRPIHAQGGPPFIADDPGTPGNRQ